MRRTIEATWREGFLNPDALVAPKVNDRLVAAASTRQRAARTGPRRGNTPVIGQAQRPGTVHGVVCC